MRVVFIKVSMRDFASISSLIIICASILSSPATKTKQNRTYDEKDKIVVNKYEFTCNKLTHRYAETNVNPMVDVDRCM